MNLRTEFTDAQFTWGTFNPETNLWTGVVGQVYLWKIIFDKCLACKITPGMELFEQQYFTEQYIILTRTEEGHEKD